MVIIRVLFNIELLSNLKYEIMNENEILNKSIIKNKLFKTFSLCTQHIKVGTL